VPVDLDRIAAGDTVGIFDDFHAMHERAYGFSSPADECEIVTMRLVVSVAIDKPSLEERTSASPTEHATPTLRSVYMPGSGWVDATIYDRSSFERGARLDGPAVVHQADSTTLVPPFASLVVDEHANLVLTIEESA
jgi:N-methylhydantoinase A